MNSTNRKKRPRCVVCNRSDAGGGKLPSLQSIGLQAFAPEALAHDVEDRSIIKDTVKGAQEGVFLIEVLSPQGRTPVAGEDDVESALLVVAAVNQVEEKAGVLLVEFAVPDLVNDEAGRTDEAGEHGGRLLRPPGGGELVSKLRRLDEIGLQAVLAAFVAESLSQVRFARSGRANESQVPVGVDGCEGPDALELLQVGEALAPEHTEVEVLKGLGDLLREPAHAQDGLDRGLFLLFPEVFEEYRHTVQRILRKASL